MEADGEGVVLRGVGKFDPRTTPLDADGQGIPYASYAFAAQAALVEVDVALGTVRCLSIVAAHDVGRAVNPTLVVNQGFFREKTCSALISRLPHRPPERRPHQTPTAALSEGRS